MTNSTTTAPRTYCARNNYPWSPKFGPTPYALHDCTGGKFCKGNCKPSNKLPSGKRCVDCKYIARCFMLMSRSGDETECDWAPSRFVDATAQKA